MRLALRTALKIRPRDSAVFEELFALLWKARAASRMPEQRVSRRAPEVPRARPGSPRPGGLPSDGASESFSTISEGEEPGYSPEAALRRKPFEECSPDDLQAMEQLLSRLGLRLATRPSRRRVPVRGRGEPDLRAQLPAGRGARRENSSRWRAGRGRWRSPAWWCWRTPAAPWIPTPASCSPSCWRCAGWRGRSEIFAFNTALVRLTPWLRPGRIDLALERLAASVPDWSGGTRIGECLAEFVEYYLDELVDGKTVVLILSDGLDRGDVAPLAAALRAIRARARRVVWLNPLAGDARYEPTARAMAAALPYIDDLLPAHNLESLERLLPLLAA